MLSLNLPGHLDHVYLPKCNELQPCDCLIEYLREHVDQIKWPVSVSCCGETMNVNCEHFDCYYESIKNCIFQTLSILFLPYTWNTHLTTIMLFSLACHLWPRVFPNISEYERPWLQNSTPISVFHQHIEQFAETGSRPKQSKGSDVSVFPSLLSLCPSTCTPSILNRPCSALAAPIIQLSFNPQAKNNPWTVNQCRGVVALDRSAALNGPQGFRWRRTKWAPFHPLLVQIKLKASVRGSACGQVICGLRWEKKKNRSKIHP